MALALTLNLNPPFQVDFSQFARQKQASNLQRVENIAFRVLKLIKILFTSTIKSAYQTVRHSGTSFKHIVLGYYGDLSQFRPPADIYLAVFKVFFWIASMGWCFITTACRNTYNEMRGNKNIPFLQQFAGKEIDIAHIQTKEIAIDVSGIPADVTVNHLLEIFDQINFDRPGEPGYMAPISRREGSTTYTKYELRESLIKFVGHVQRRVAFLGTPPAYDTPQLMAFYQQIEDAARFSIHKAQQDLREFQNRGSNNQQVYRNLLENQARVALSLAIAGKHCGARFMGEAMELYDNAKGEDGIAQGTLKECLIELLAYKRKEIALAQIQRYLGSDTHSYNQYMAGMGQLLAIPGTQNVIEHLSQNLDRSLYTRRFFEKYTEEFILAAIQEKVKKSQIFREKITDWLRDQVGDWRKIEDRRIFDNKLRRADDIFKELLSADFALCNSLTQFASLIRNLHPIHLPNQNLDWSDFVDELFTLDAIRDKLPSDRVEKAHFRQGIKSLEQLGKDSVEKMKQGNVASEGLRESLLCMQKVSRLATLTGLERETLLRVVKGEKQLIDALCEQDEQERRNRFLEALNLEQIAQNGLPPELLEWVVVAHEILLPQTSI